MATLVTIAELKDYLAVTGTAEDGVLQPILDDTERQFIQETGRTSAPFSAAQVGRVEQLRGTGCERLHLDYPIADVTDIKLGFDSSDPDETLDPDLKTVVIWQVGSTIIERVDGGAFGRFGWPSYCHITYDTQVDKPRDAARAIIHAAAVLYRQRGSEDAKQETIGGQTVTMADPYGIEWQQAVANHTRWSTP
jgi:hypothetical protein